MRYLEVSVTSQGRAGARVVGGNTIARFESCQDAEAYVATDRVNQLATLRLTEFAPHQTWAFTDGARVWPLEHGGRRLYETQREAIAALGEITDGALMVTDDGRIFRLT